MQLAISQIRIDGGTQPRAAYHFGAAESYAEDMEAGAVFPPVIVFFDGTEYWLADGFHRVLAAEKLDQPTIDADIRQGTLQDAQWYSYSVNQTHGLRRTNEDKRRAVEAALRHPRAAGMSDREIAAHVGVHFTTVNGYRGEMKTTVGNLQSPIRIGRDGRTINTANIGKANGKKPDAPPPAHRDEEEEPLPSYKQQVHDPLLREVDRLVLQYQYDDLCRLLELLAERIAVNA